jgi:hypothetical protein
MCGAWLVHPGEMRLEIIDLSRWKDRTMHDSRVTIHGRVTAIHKTKALRKPFVSGNSLKANQLMIIRYWIPLTYFAASMSDRSFSKSWRLSTY